jgi:AmmeMemoRadiSam system protein B
MMLHAAHAGQAYPNDPDSFRTLVRTAVEAAPPVSCPDTLPMLIVPHIDLRIDLETYAAAYRAWISRSSFPETIAILGVGHRCPHEFSLVPTRFTTPLGVVESEAETCDAIRTQLDFETARSPETWEGEHSLEFAIVWLQALRDLYFPGRVFRVVPVLMGGLWSHIQRGVKPGPRAQVSRFGRALFDSVRQRTGSAILASIDGCHVGPRFDHPFSGAEARLGVQRWERTLWDHCRSDRHADWFAHLAGVQNIFYFDGVGVLDLLLRNCHRKARVLHHRLWYDEDDQSFVTFTAAILDHVPKSESSQT